MTKSPNANRARSIRASPATSLPWCIRAAWPQTLAFALAKEGHQLEYADDLATVLTSAGFVGVDTARKLTEKTHGVSVAEYLRLSRAGLAAAVWLKRYVEASAEK